MKKKYIKYIYLFLMTKNEKIHKARRMDLDYHINIIAIQIRAHFVF